MAQTIAKSSLVTAVKDQVFCSLGEEAVVLQLKDGVYYGLNEVGTTIWNYLQEQRSVEEIEKHVLERYDVTVERCEEEVQEFLHNLADAGLIEVRPEVRG